jgi:predicted RNA binding protein YcfA (HicA-like mRNA interferase family)
MPRIPGIKHQDAVRALEKAGFQISRLGKHIVMSNGTHQVTIPRHNPIKAFTMGGLVRDAGLTVESVKVCTGSDQNAMAEVAPARCYTHSASYVYPTTS